MCKVKICGIREIRHLHTAVESGASYVGFVFCRKSRRNLSIKTAQRLADETPNRIVRVALMVDPTDNFINNILRSVKIDMLQLHGNETIDRVVRIKHLSGIPVMKAIGINQKSDLSTIKKYELVADQILLDAKPPIGASVPGGLGKCFDWNILKDFRCKKPWLLAGGLTAENVRNAVKITGATQVDVSSGVEDSSGAKNERKIVKFLNSLEGDADE